MKLDFNFTGKTLLKDWWKQVKTNFQTVQDDFNSHVSDFNTAKTALENKIISEADARNKADTALQNNINKHAAEKATDSKYSHVKLSDSVTSASGISGATAATPAAVKTAYDKAVEVQNNLDTEKSSRQNADTVLQQNIDTEAANRQNADNALQQDIGAEALARASADTGLDRRVKAVEDTAHTHVNKTVLDGISDPDIAAWNGITEQVTQAQLDAVKAYLEELCFGFSDEFQRIYGAIGVNVYDGGIFGMEQNEIALDGGDFEDEVTGAVDCGGFEPIIISTEVGAVIDGGEY